MILANVKFWEYKKGYDRIIQLASAYESVWQSSLLQIQEKEQREFVEAQKIWESEETTRIAIEYKNNQVKISKRRNYVIGLIISILSIPIFISIIIPFLFYILGPQAGLGITCVTFLIFPILLGAPFFFIVALLVLAASSLIVPISVPHPIKQSLNPSDIFKYWANAVSVKYHSGNNTEGTRGEYILVNELHHLPINYICVAGVLIDAHLDLDACVVGPTGVWILESKYWQGEIRYSDGKWNHSRKYYSRGGYRQSEEREITFPPDEQWQLQASMVINLLSTNLPMEYNMIKKWIKGGIAFTHPNMHLDINSCPVECGTSRLWMERISAEDTISEITPEITYQIIDILLDNSNKISYLQDRQSTIEVAESIFQVEKRKLDMLLGKSE
jgi:hypothetical protein